jgi:hypothetical protein
MRSLFADDGDIVLATFIVVEASSAIWRQWREMRNEIDRDTALSGLAQLHDTALKVDDMEAVVRRARDLFARHALKGADALQLASALTTGGCPRADSVRYARPESRKSGACRRLTVINVNEDSAHEERSEGR